MNLKLKQIHQKGMGISQNAAATPLEGPKLFPLVFSLDAFAIMSHRNEAPV